MHCPMTFDRIIDTYFLEHRAKLIDIAAFLDRLDRAHDAEATSHDFRIDAFRRALDVVGSSEGGGGRARRVLECFSDHTDALETSAPNSKGACGAPRPAQPLDAEE